MGNVEINERDLAILKLSSQGLEVKEITEMLTKEGWKGVGVDSINKRLMYFRKLYICKNNIQLFNLLRKRGIIE